MACQENQHDNASICFMMSFVPVDPQCLMSSHELSLAASAHDRLFNIKIKHFVKCFLLSEHNLYITLGTLWQRTQKIFTSLNEVVQNRAGGFTVMQNNKKMYTMSAGTTQKKRKIQNTNKHINWTGLFWLPIVQVTHLCSITHFVCAALKRHQH